jgi:hypothetical protein
LNLQIGDCPTVIEDMRWWRRIYTLTPTLDDAIVESAYVSKTAKDMFGTVTNEMLPCGDGTPPYLKMRSGPIDFVSTGSQSRSTMLFSNPKMAFALSVRLPTLVGGGEPSSL